MSLTNREFWTAVHGMVLGAVFLIAFTGAAVSLWGMRGEWMTAAGREAGGRGLVAGAWVMAVLAWGTVVTGTFVVYPWYRAVPAAGVTGAGLGGYPKFLLVASEKTAGWHEFGMEWKEHVGWLAPMLATGVAVVATSQRKRLADQVRLRQMMLVMLAAAFFCAGVAGMFGAFINKMAPVR